MGYLSANIGVLVGVGGQAPSVRSNAGSLEAEHAPFPMVSLTGGEVDLIVSLVGGDLPAIAFLDVLIAELQTLRRAALRRASGVTLRQLVAAPVAEALERAQKCANCGQSALDHRDATGACPGDGGTFFKIDEEAVVPVTIGLEPKPHEWRRTGGTYIPTHAPGAYPALCSDCAERATAPAVLADATAEDER